MRRRSPAAAGAEEIGGRATADGVPSTLVFDAAGRVVSGSGGCNPFMGPAEVGAGSIRFGALAATRMACPPPGMEQENRFFAALAKAERWRIGADGRLVLTDAADGPLVVLGRQPSCDPGGGAPGAARAVVSTPLARDQELTAIAISTAAFASSHQASG